MRQRHALRPARPWPKSSPRRAPAASNPLADGYRISKTAERQLAEIIDFTDQAFGVLQTDAYVAGLKHSFELIAEFPSAGVAAFEIKLGWRRHRFQSHYIFYSSQSGQVLIEAIIHVRRSLRPDLFES